MRRRGSLAGRGALLLPGVALLVSMATADAAEGRQPSKERIERFKAQRGMSGKRVFPGTDAALTAAEARLTASPILSRGAADEVADAFLAARATFFREWAKMHGHGEDEWAANRIYRKLSEVAERRRQDFHKDEPAQVRELLWRTWLGRAAALRAAGREAKLMAEGPRWGSDGSECPKALAEGCRAHMDALLAAFPGIWARDPETGGVHQRVVLEMGGDPSSFYTQSDLFFLPRRLEPFEGRGSILIAARPARYTDKKGKRRWTYRGAELGFRSGSDCEERLRGRGGE